MIGYNAGMTPFFIVIACVAAAIGLYFLLAWLAMRSRKPCPYCGVKAVQTVNSVLATIIVDGKRMPDSWSYCECDVCHARYKDHRGVIETPSDEEWQRHFDKK